MAEVGRGSLLRGSQATHVAQVGNHRVGQVARHRPGGDPHRLLGIAHDRQHECAGAPGGGFVAAQLSEQRGFRSLAVAADRQAQREAADDFVVARCRSQCLTIIALGAEVIADQIVGQPAVAGEATVARAGALGRIEQGYRGERVLVLDQRARQRGLDPRIVG